MKGDDAADVVITLIRITFIVLSAIVMFHAMIGKRGMGNHVPARCTGQYLIVKYNIEDRTMT
jgi:hypothetical protein